MPCATPGSAGSSIERRVVADRPLHIGIDGRELLGKPTGVGRYTAEVLRVWASDGDERFRYTVFVPAEPSDMLRRLGPRVEWVVVAASHAGTLWEQARLPGALRRAGVDVLFAPGYTAPLRTKIPFVVVIHDVSFFAHPEWFGQREGWRRRRITKASAERAARVLTVSEFSASEIVRYLGITRDRIELAPNGPPAAAVPPEHATRVPTVLYVGSLFNRRRIPDLLRGFAIVARDLPAARLVMVGDNRTIPPLDPNTEATALGIGDRVEWRAYLPDEELNRLYQSARAFAFLSDYEGFAITPIEAIAHGVPPVLLDTPVAREIYGAGALLVPPDPAAIAAALETLLTDDDAHARLLAAGRRRIADFSWARTAAKVRAVLAEAARA